MSGPSCPMTHELCDERMKHVDQRLKKIEETQEKIWSKLNSLQINLTALKSQWMLIGAIVVVVIDVALRLVVR